MTDEDSFEDRPRPALTVPSASVLACMGVLLSLVFLEPPASWVCASLVLVIIGVALGLSLRFAPQMTVRGHELHVRVARRTTVFDLNDVVSVTVDWILQSGSELTLRWPNGDEIRLPVNRSTRALRRHLGQAMSSSSARYGSPWAREVLFL